MQPHHGGTVSNTRMRTEMDVIDREREKEWLEQMDTILVFVCLTSFHIGPN